MIFTSGQAWRRRWTNRLSPVGRAHIARAQMRPQQRLAAKHVARQETIITVVAVEERAGLSAMHAVVGRVKIQNQLGEWSGKRSDELLDQHRLHRPGDLPVGAIFQPAQRGAARQRDPVPRRLARPDRGARCRDH